jgi:putative intracellular protease/amidase
VKTWPRRVLDTTLTLTLATATLTGIAVAGVVVTSRSTHQPVPTRSTHPAPASPEYAEPDSSAGHLNMKTGRRLVVAFVVGQSGTIASDLLAPYDIFASSPAFTTYVVAQDAAPAPLEGGPAVVPTYTFADVDADPALAPDLVVVPALTKPTGDIEAPLRRWVTRRHDAGARVLGVCSGSLVLAATGMLDGLDATSHWSRINALQARHPAVHWVRGRRYVEDGSVTTTAAVTSGVPAALHLVAELAGPAEAQRVADLHPELGWTPTETTHIRDDHFTAGDWPVGLNYLEPWFRPTIGIALRDGVGEFDATAAFEVYSQSAAGHTIAIATGNTIRTRHGLLLLTTNINDAPALTRVLVPDATPDADTPDGLDPRLHRWADRQQLTIEPLTGRPRPDRTQGGGGFTAALQNLADHTDAATTTATAKMVGYPTTGLNLGTQHRPWRTALLGLASLALAVLLGRGPAYLTRRRRTRSLGNAPTPESGVEQTEPWTSGLEPSMQRGASSRQPRTRELPGR